MSNIFEQAFTNNFYLTKEYLHFCSKTTNIIIKEKYIENNKIITLKNKNPSINNYQEDFRLLMQQNNISYISVLPEINSNFKNPSFIEYSIIHKKPYEEIIKDYTNSFKNGLRNGRKYIHTISILHEVDKETLSKVYNIYNLQMKRHNSFRLPKTFFVEFMKCPSSLLFLIKYENDIIAYSFCFEYKDNLYRSIGGGNEKYFKYRCVNKLYDETIRYASRKNLNIHLGIGEHNSNYNNFKKNAGSICYKCERFPNDDNLLKLSLPFLRFKVTGFILNLLSKLMPKKITYLLMPFT